MRIRRKILMATLFLLDLGDLKHYLWLCGFVGVWNIWLCKYVGVMISCSRYDIIIIIIIAIGLIGWIWFQIKPNKPIALMPNFDWQIRKHHKSVNTVHCQQIVRGYVLFSQEKFVYIYEKS